MQNMGCLSSSLSILIDSVARSSSSPHHYPNLLGVHPILAVDHHGGGHRGHIAILFGETGPDNRHIWFFLSPCHMMTFFILIVSLGGSSLHQLGNTTRLNSLNWYFSRSTCLCSRLMKHCEKEVSERVTNSDLYWGLLLISDGSITDWSHSEINQVI